MTTLGWKKERKYGVNYDIVEFDISLSCDVKDNGGLQLVKSACVLLDASSLLFNDSLVSDVSDVESYDSPPLWDDECDGSFDFTLTLLEESFELYEETSQEEFVDEFFDSVSIPLEERFNFYDEMSKCECGDDLVESKKENKVFDASTSIICFTYIIPSFERTISLDFTNASLRKVENVSFGVLNDHCEQKEPNVIDYFVKVHQEKVAKGKESVELTLRHIICQELFLLPISKNVQGKENTFKELQGKIVYPSTHDTLVDCGDTLSLKDSYDIVEFDISLSCDVKDNGGLQLVKSACVLLDASSLLFNDSLVSDVSDVESYDSPPLWDDECDGSFDFTLTLLEESFELYEETSQEEFVDEFFDSVSIPLEERFNFYDEMSKCECGDDLVESKKENKVFDASTSIICFTYIIPSFERTISLDFTNASLRKVENVSFGVLNDHCEQKEPNVIDYFVKVHQEKVAKGKESVELTLRHIICQELFLLPISKN
ncbi:hypothetical protein A4A49_42572, partial [Nicotiana attenuata]